MTTLRSSDMSSLAIAGLALPAFPGLAVSAPIQGCFADGEALVRQLAAIHGEVFEPLPNGEVVSAEDWRLATYRSPITGSSTVVSHRDGSACVMLAD
jgi:hypothetical protein